MFLIIIYIRILLTALPTEALFLGFYSKHDDLIKTAHNNLWNKIFQCLDTFPFHPGQENEPIFIKVHMLLKIHE